MSNKIITVFGMKGSGKTVRGVRSFNEYKDLKFFWNYQLEQYPLKGEVFADLESHKWQKNSYVFYNNVPELLPIVVDYIVSIQRERLKKRKKAHMLLVLDECDEFANHQMGVNHPNFQAMKTLCRKVRNINIDIIFISQKPQRLHPDIYDQTDVFYFYFLNSKDWKFLRNNAWLEISDEAIEYTKPYKSYKYVEVHQSGEIVKHEPLILDKDWDRCKDEES